MSSLLKLPVNWKLKLKYVFTSLHPYYQVWFGERSVGGIHHTGSPLEMQLSNVFEHNLFTSVCVQMSSTCATIVNKFPLIYNQLTSSLSTVTSQEGVLIRTCRSAATWYFLFGKPFKSAVSEHRHPYEAWRFLCGWRLQPSRCVQRCIVWIV